MTTACVDQSFVRLLMKRAADPHREEDDDSESSLLPTLVGGGLAIGAGALLGKLIGRYGHQLKSRISDLRRGSVDSRLGRLLNNKVMDLQRAFVDNVVVPTSREFGHARGRRFRPGFVDKLRFVASKMPAGNPMSTLVNENLIKVDPDQRSSLMESELAHEIAHAQYDYPVALSATGRGILDRAYRFRPQIKEVYGRIGKTLTDAEADAAARMEQTAVNRGIRFDIFRSLAKRIGRSPTYDEFKAYVRTAPDRAIARHVLTHAGLNLEGFKTGGGLRGWLKDLVRTAPGIDNANGGIAYLYTDLANWIKDFIKKNGKAPTQKDIEQEIRRRDIRRALLEIAKRTAGSAAKAIA